MASSARPRPRAQLGVKVKSKLTQEHRLEGSLCGCCSYRYVAASWGHILLLHTYIHTSFIIYLLLYVPLMSYSNAAGASKCCPYFCPLACLSASTVGFTSVRALSAWSRFRWAFRNSSHLSIWRGLNFGTREYLSSFFISTLFDIV